MSNLRNQLRINIGFLLNQAIGYSREFCFDCPSMELSQDLSVQDLTGLARVNRTPQGLLINSDFKASVRLECVRCLDSFQQPLRAIFDELYAFNERTATESALILPDDGYIDLQPLVREYLLIEIPINPLCNEDCMGLCMICGANRNKVTCNHEEPPEGKAT